MKGIFSYVAFAGLVLLAGYSALALIQVASFSAIHATPSERDFSQYYFWLAIFAAAIVGIGFIATHLWRSRKR